MDDIENLRLKVIVKHIIQEGNEKSYCREYIFIFHDQSEKKVI